MPTDSIIHSFTDYLISFDQRTMSVIDIDIVQFDASQHSDRMGGVITNSPTQWLPVKSIRVPETFSGEIFLSEQSTPIQIRRNIEGSESAQEILDFLKKSTMLANRTDGIKKDTHNDIERVYVSKSVLAEAFQLGFVGILLKYVVTLTGDGDCLLMTGSVQASDYSPYLALLDAKAARKTVTITALSSESRNLFISHGYRPEYFPDAEPSQLSEDGKTWVSSKSFTEEISAESDYSRQYSVVLS